MFDIGLWEILLVIIVALLVIKPEELPNAAQKAGNLLKHLRRWLQKTDLSS